MISPSLQEILDNEEWEKAINFIKQRYTEPYEDDVLEKLVWCYSRNANYNLSIILCDELIVRSPQKAKWYYLKGYQYYMQKKWSDSVEWYCKAIELYNDYFIVKYRLAYAYLQIAGINNPWSKDVFWKAIKQLEECHTIYFNYTEEEKAAKKTIYADICGLHGKTIISSERYINKGIELLKTAISLEKNDDFLYQLSKAYYLKKDYEKAIEVLPNIEKYYVIELRSQILTDSGKIVESNNLLLTLVKRRRKDYLYQRISENYLLLDDIDKAVEYAKTAININKDNYKNYLLYGTIEYKLGNNKTAIMAFETAKNKKQTLYKSDCVEAIHYIEEINLETDNNPIDKITLDKQTTNTIHVGVIIKYMNEKGYGFIRDNDSGINYFFHISNYTSKNSPKIGDIVLYKTITTSKGASAIDVCIK